MIVPFCICSTRCPMACTSSFILSGPGSRGSPLPLRFLDAASPVPILLLQESLSALLDLSLAARFKSPRRAASWPLPPRTAFSSSHWRTSSSFLLRSSSSHGRRCSFSSFCILFLASFFFFAAFFSAACLSFSRSSRPSTSASAATAFFAACSEAVASMRTCRYGKIRCWLTSAPRSTHRIFVSSSSWCVRAACSTSILLLISLIYSLIQLKKLKSSSSL